MQSSDVKLEWQWILKEADYNESSLVQIRGFGYSAGKPGNSLGAIVYPRDIEAPIEKALKDGFVQVHSAPNVEGLLRHRFESGIGNFSDGVATAFVWEVVAKSGTGTLSSDAQTALEKLIDSILDDCEIYYEVDSKGNRSQARSRLTDKPKKVVKERDVAVDKPKGIDVSADVLHFLGLKVWSGLYDQDEILESAMEAIEEEWFEDNDSLDEETLYDMIAKAMLKKQKVEKTWPPETDCDRLKNAFRELTLRGIVCVENAGYTMEEGWEDFWEAVDDSGWERDAVRGGCFYHGQDLERAVLGYDIDLAFGATAGGDEADAAIAREVVEVIASHGFSPAWGGSVDERISLPINWQRRSGPIADTSPPDMHLQNA